jgi:hypothetical protein
VGDPSLELELCSDSFPIVVVVVDDDVDLAESFALARSTEAGPHRTTEQNDHSTFVPATYNTAGQ